MATKSLLAPALVLLASCAALSPELAQQSETAFRQQNQVASEILLLLDELSPEQPNYQALTQAEDTMLKACKPLNDVAIRYRDQRSVGPIKKLRIPRSVENCRKAAEDAEKLIETVNATLD